MYSQSNISRFRRKLRNDPFFGLFKHRFYFRNDRADATEISEWLEQRYQRWDRHQYRISFYPSNDGSLYAHCVYMQTLSDTDLIFAKLKWNLSDLSVRRGDRVRKSWAPEPLATAVQTAPQFSADEAALERERLVNQAVSAGWSPARLRAKQAWVTMRTVGWHAPTIQPVGA
jgi:hypothetical protein